MKHTHVRQAAALLCAVSLLLALGACAPVDTVKGWFSSDAKPYAGYDLDKHIKLGAYKGVEAEFVTEEEYLDLYMEEAVFAQYAAPRGIADDPAKETVAEGDLVYFDYEGTVEGATEADLEGMKGTAMLFIGSGNFIEGFEGQIVGQPRDKEFDVNVSFPDPYPDENGENIVTLAGKPAVFKCTVHMIGAESEQITDEGVTGLTGGQYGTVEEFRALMMSDIEQQYQQSIADVVAQYNTNQAYTAAFSTAEFLKIPAKEQQYWNKQLTKEAESNGLSSADEYATQSGYESAQALGDEQIKHELFSFAVAAKEELAVTEEDLQALLSEIRTGGETGSDKEIYDLYGGKGRMIRMLMMEKASTFIYENASGTPAAVS